MSLLQLARCCSCARPQLPCSDCDTAKCVCEEQEYFEYDKPQYDKVDLDDPAADYEVKGSNIPVTSIHIEVSPASTRRFRATSTKDSMAWHYMNNKKWRASEFGPSGVDLTKITDRDLGFGRFNRLVFYAQAWMNGYRFGDKLFRLSDKIMPLTLPAGQWGKTPSQGLNQRKAKCGCQGNLEQCGNYVLCCYCDPPGGAHNSGITLDYLCLEEGGQIRGDENTPGDVCTPFCENQVSGFSVARLGELIPDPLRKGGESIANKLRFGRLKSHLKYLLRQNAVETATNPVIRPDEAYDRIAKEEQEAFDKREMIPVSDIVDGLTPRYQRQEAAAGTAGDCGECIGNQCTGQGPFWEQYFDAFDQRKSGVWNYVPENADCCDARYAGVSYTIEMDWPCEDTASAYIKAKQKFDFGTAAYEEAQRYCGEEGAGTRECGGPGPANQAHLCHPLAQELIGAEPPNLIPCIKTCPLQKGDAACQEGWRRWPQGDFIPDGENVLQTIPCLGGADVINPNDDDVLPEDVVEVDVVPTGEMGCTFKTNPVNRNYRSIVDCAEHQCGPALCGGQYCCRVESCIEYDCCEQLDVNPQTGEYAEYNEDGCIVDKDGEYIGGWRTYPDEDGTYFRCPMQEVGVEGFDEFNQPVTICKGCTQDRSIDSVCVDCTPPSQIPSCRGSGSFCEPRGDILNWVIPRKKGFDAAQGTYARHCPDHLEPFTLRQGDVNYWSDARCDRKFLPSIGDRGVGRNEFCWYDPRNPTGTFCSGGFCTYYNNQSGAIGRPYHQWPIEDIRFTGCSGEHTDDKGPCEKQYKFCPQGGGGEVAGPLDPNDPNPPTRPGQGPNGPGGELDDCQFWCLEDALLDKAHHPAACGATPCDDKGVYVNRVTGETIVQESSSQGVPDNSGNWILAGCYRCPFDGLGRKTRDNQGCGPSGCEGVQGYTSNLMGFYDGYFADEIGLQLIGISCSPQNHRSFQNEELGTYNLCSGKTSPKYSAEKHFQVFLEYKGGGAGYNGFGTMRKGCSRTGQGFATLAKSEESPSTCVFGHYTKMIGRNDGWYTSGGANPAPYWQSFVNPGDDYYYKGMLGYDEEGRPDCSRRIWYRPNNNFGCKFNPPSVLII
jgi:hypothetical protein